MAQFLHFFLSSSYGAGEGYAGHHPAGPVRVQYFSFFVCRFSHFGGGFLKSRKNEYKERMFYCQGENVTPGLGSYEGISENIWMQVTAGGTGFYDRNPILGP